LERRAARVERLDVLLTPDRGAYRVDHPRGRFALFIGPIENGGKHPFEVWVNGAEQPRGLGALAKSLSMDMRSNDHGWLKAKLDSLMRAHGDHGLEPPKPNEPNSRRRTIVRRQKARSPT
jgi:ribonucleoside-diphosphate reductase alpha chain